MMSDAFQFPCGGPGHSNFRCQKPFLIIPKSNKTYSNFSIDIHRFTPGPGHLHPLLHPIHDGLVIQIPLSETLLNHTQDQ